MNRWPARFALSTRRHLPPPLRIPVELDVRSLELIQRHVVAILGDLGANILPRHMLPLALVLAELANTLQRVDANVVVDGPYGVDHVLLDALLVSHAFVEAATNVLRHYAVERAELFGGP